MAKRYVSIWFRHLTTDKFILRQPGLKTVPFVLAAPERGRMVVKAANALARQNRILPGMVVADARALFPDLQVLPDQPGLADKLLHKLAEWSMRFTPIAGVDMPDGLMLDASGCSHLWGGEQAYMQDIVSRLQHAGYEVRATMADTIGAAWAVARFGDAMLVEAGQQAEALRVLPSGALRLGDGVPERLARLGLYTIGSFMQMPRQVLQRRFGPLLLTRLDQALGAADELLNPVQVTEPYHVRQPFLIPVCTAAGIAAALEELLVLLCQRLEKEGKGLRRCTLKCFRVDGDTQEISISTGSASRHTAHLFKLFEPKIVTLSPDLGFELFLLEAPVVEEVTPAQEALWHNGGHRNDPALAELLDRITSKMGGGNIIKRYLPDEHTWPESSMKPAATVTEVPATGWRTDQPRPIHLLPKPEQITVTVPIPDYPPMLFHYKGVLHKVKKADGPERIEQEWWIAQGEYRDYYTVEDEKGCRYWLFRLGHYEDGAPEWYLHGFFA